MNEFPYERGAALEYAHQWAKKRNPAYYDFSELGGDCTNFISQCLFAGTKVMNHTPETGWFYYDINNRTPSWSGVEFFYDFLVSNKGMGPFARDSEMFEVTEGDIVQLKMSQSNFTHTLIIVSIGKPLSMGSILVAAHSIDSDYRPLDTYAIKDIRFLSVQGYRK
ncbi:MAG: amidase domain-containing protein [Clostridiales bacterium]|jgi:hypothetical protein|nr:amidase domain-containing protein [Clostridiales bacterium]